MILVEHGINAEPIHTTGERIKTLVMIIGVVIAAIAVFYAALVIVHQYFAPAPRVIVDPSDSRITVSPTDVKGYVTVINLHRERAVRILKVVVGGYECRVLHVISIRGYAAMTREGIVVYPESKATLVLEVPRAVLQGGLPIPVRVYCEGGVAEGAITLVQVTSG